jgi:arylsulfatase A-like enzyme
LVGLVDLAPTILDLCGIMIPAEMQGHSLRPLIAGEDDPFDRSHLLIMDEDGHLALRTARWKLITSGSGQRLFDLDVDPDERRDLAADAATLPAVKGLLRMLEEEERRAFALRAKVGIADARGVSLSESEIKKLKALGYLVEDS